MKNRLHNKKAGIAILVALIITSLAEVVYRTVAMGLDSATTTNFGEQLIVIALAVTILIMTAKGKDRACYICYGAWAGYFILDQLFELPGMITNLLTNLSNPVITLSIALRLVTMVCIIAIGALLVEYMNDGSIYNRAFNALCLITLLLLAVDIGWGVYQLVFASVEGMDVTLLKKQNMLVIFNSVYRLIMIFLFTFFAYDSAKAQLKKVNFSK